MPMPRPLYETEYVVKDSRNRVLRRFVKIPGGFRPVPIMDEDTARKEPMNGQQVSPASDEGASQRE